MPIRLSFDSGALAGVRIVSSAKAIRLGRDPAQNDILLTNPHVSRRHVVITRMVNGWMLEVVGSGPTKLNGDPFQALTKGPAAHLLQSGDRIDVGGVELVAHECLAKLIVVAGPNAGREIALDGGTTVGASGDCSLVLDDRTVAPLHLDIQATPLGFKCEAKAGALINGTRLQEHVLAHGDELVLGATTLRFSVVVPNEDVGVDDEAVPPPPAEHGAVGELVFIAGAAKGQKIALGESQIILGTRGECTFVLNDPMAAGIHCAISKNKDEFVATDLRTEVGTMINGQRITQGTPLRAGDLIAVGAHVLEARLLGGVTMAKKGATMFTMMPGGFQGPQPRFVIDGRVVSSRKIVIGRAPSCEIIVDGNTASREHCSIEFKEMGFAVSDMSRHGTYVDDKRVVTQQLPPSCVLRAGTTSFRVSLRGEVCTIERADAALAQAAVDVARQQASMLGRATVMASAGGGGGGVKMPTRMSAPNSAGAMKTIFILDANQLEHEIKSRKKDLKRNAPAWRPSSDLQRNPVLRGAVTLSVLAALGLCGAVFAFGKGEALVNHPLSEAHASPAFADQAKGVTVCGACHSAGAHTDSDACISCHAGFLPRKKHVDKHAAENCGDCHREHDGAKKGTALGGGDGCQGCHSGQHKTDFDADGPQHVVAGKIPYAYMPREKNPCAPDDKDCIKFHTAHSSVVINGKRVGLGCTSCHADSGANGALTEKKKPAFACFRCHDGKDEVKNGGGCEFCHGSEHGKKMATPKEPPNVAAIGNTPSPGIAIGIALGLAFVGSSPAFLFGAWSRLRRRRLQRKLVAELKEHPAEVVKRLVHSMNSSKCVGCGMCVQACPASVLELVEHKSQVVNFDACIQCKRCENACAFDALRMHDADKPPPMVAMPSIDAFHETPVPGMFLVGQASGVPQVKNATNLGRSVVQRMAQQGVKPGIGKQMGCDVDIVVVGSGPSGLAAAVTCIELGFSYVVLEKERQFSWTIRNYYHKGKEVMAEPHDIGLESSVPHWDSSREELLGAWEQIVNMTRMDIRYQSDVTDVKKEGDKFAITIGDPKKPAGRITCARVVLAIGTLGNPRKLGCPGEDLEKVKNSLVDPDEWRGKDCMVVGGSDSAVEVVLALARPELGNRVIFSTRGAKLEGIKPKNRKLIEDALAANKFQMRYATQVAEVSEKGIALTHKDDGRREDLPNDVVFAMIGGNSPQKWLQGIGIPYIDKPHSWSPPRTDLLSQKTAEGLVQIRRIQGPPIPKSTKAHH
jgi:predicted CXXCH cytochrome family protein